MDKLEAPETIEIFLGLHWAKQVKLIRGNVVDVMIPAILKLAKSDKIKNAANDRFDAIATEENNSG